MPCLQVHSQGKNRLTGMSNQQMLGTASPSEICGVRMKDERT